MKNNQELILKRIKDLSTDGICIIDQAGVILDLNNAAKSILALITRDDALGLNYVDILPLNIRNKALDFFNSIINNGGFETTYFSIPLVDKSILELEIRTCLLNNLEIKTSPILVILKNISNTKAIGERTQILNKLLEDIFIPSSSILSERERMYQIIIQHLKDMIWVVDNDSRINYVSPSTTKILGYTPEEVYGLIGMSFIHPDDLFTTQSSLLELLEKKSDKVLFEFRVRHLCGHYLCFEAEAEYLIDYPGIDGIVVRAHDVSIQKEAELLLRNSEEKFKNIFHSSSDGITITDIKGNYLETNQIAIERTGLSHEQFLKMNVRDILRDKYPGHLDKMTDHILRFGNMVFETDYISKEGKCIYIEIRSKLIQFSGVPAIMHLTRDITDCKNLEKEVVKTMIETEERERNRFAQDLHDGLGALLSGVKMYLSLMRNVQFSEMERNNMLDKTSVLISKAAQSAREIANNIKPPELARFGLIATLNSFIDRILGEMSIDVQLNFNNYNIRLRDDIELVIYRVVSELINNTIQHAEASKIEIELYNANGILFLNYLDNGKGFDFDTKRHDQSSGMGLRNVINRINSLDGEISVVSQAGEGFKFIAEIKIKEKFILFAKEKLYEE